MSDSPRLIVALDFPSAESALAMAERLDPALCRLKVGKELFTRCGPSLVEALQVRGFQVFLDLKFHDIPNTTAAACRAAADLGVWMLNVHAGGGRRMLEAAREAIENVSQRPLLIAVTVLTSLEKPDLEELGVNADPQRQVLRLARLTRQTGLDGVVCSAQEAGLLRAELGPDFCLVTPGIRLAALDQEDDQRRVMTPRAAVEAGADYLVIGRPVTGAPDPVLALRAIHAELKGLFGASVAE